MHAQLLLNAAIFKEIDEISAKRYFWGQFIVTLLFLFFIVVDFPDSEQMESIFRK